jgi:hypothetical protein
MHNDCSDTFKKFIKKQIKKFEDKQKQEEHWLWNSMQLLLVR